MDRKYYLDLAAKGLRMPVGADLVLREKPDHDAILLDGRRLGMVAEEAARRYRTPLAVPVMDLTVEKAALLGMLGISRADALTWHFDGCPDEQTVRTVRQHLGDPLDGRTQANVDAVAYIARNTDLLPVGMSIGPFSLMTKLLADPITPVYLAGSGITADADDEVRAVERCLEMALLIVQRSVAAQIRAGAKAIFIAEPAGSAAYLSPKQLDTGATIWDRYVMQPNRAVRRQLSDAGVDLIHHCCGELSDQMVRDYASLDPAVLSLGSSRKLWEDARLVPKITVLYGNLPTKKFYSDQLVSVERVAELTQDLLQKMRATGHPFILGSECDVLSVEGSEDAIKRKVQAFMDCKCG